MKNTRLFVPSIASLRIDAKVNSLERQIWTDGRKLAVFGSDVLDEDVSLVEARRLKMRRVKPGEYFGPANGGWKQRWFRVEIPAARADERGRRVFYWECHGETTAWLDGEPWAGLDVGHRYCSLPDKACELWLECGTYQTAIWVSGSAPDRYGLRFDGASVRLRNAAQTKAYYDFVVLRDLLQHLLQLEKKRFNMPYEEMQEKEWLCNCSPLLRRLIRMLDDACNAHDKDGLAAFQAKLKAIYSELPSEKWQPDMAVSGHSHFDMLWLWPEKVGKRKVVHTSATMLRHMARYPETYFIQTQPAALEWVRDRSPSLFKELQTRVRGGRLQWTGGFEVEIDSNMPCGEALARSVEYGQRHFLAMRGEYSRCVWLPDTFGFSAALPQIMKLAGLDYFFTTKLSWNAVTRFPYTSFVWRGPDGSDVLSHFSAILSNGGMPVASCARKVLQGDVHGEFLAAMGIGDGGGGIREEDIEKQERVRNLAGCPRARWDVPERFFRRMEKVRGDLPVHRGEIYLEYHRGTYTTQGEFKKIYRMAERALQIHEAVRVMARGEPLGESEWQDVLLSHFHDVLPGSSIGNVYREIGTRLDRLQERHVEESISELTKMSKPDSRVVSVFNPLPFARRVVVALPAACQWKTVTTGTDLLHVQKSGDERLVALDLSPLGTIRLESGGRQIKDEGALHVSPVVLDNGKVRIEFDSRGRVKSFMNGNETLDLESPAEFRIYDDQPHSFDAWEVDPNVFRLVEETAKDLELKVVEKGPVRAVLAGTASVGEASRLTLKYILESGCSSLKVELHVHWRENHKMLKYHLPTAFKGRFAAFGCAFGSVMRPQWPGSHANESMWEVPASRWAAVCDDAGNGLSLVTEAKYGFSCREGDLGLTLLRAPKDPDPQADMGEHVIRFAIGRHESRLTSEHLSTAAAADALFTPALAVRGALCADAPFQLAGEGTLVPAWILPAEKGTGYVLRLHETAGGGGAIRMVFDKAPKSVRLVDLLERPTGEPERLDDRTWRIDYAPHKIISIKVVE